MKVESSAGKCGPDWLVGSVMFFSRLKPIVKRMVAKSKQSGIGFDDQLKTALNVSNCDHS